METITIGSTPLRLEDVAAIAQRQCRVDLPQNSGWRERIQRGADVLDNMLARDGVLYGVTTGYGDSCTETVAPEYWAQLSTHLFTYHGCGLGNMLGDEEVRAVLAVRLCSLARGYSGVSLALLERLTWLLNEDILPLIPEEGSVGASGDLTPLSYVAAVLSGQRQVRFQGKVFDAAQIHQQFAYTPLLLRPKEGLALMNGTAVMTAIAALTLLRASRLSMAATSLTALNVWATQGNDFHFTAGLFAQKPHAGQIRTAERIRTALACSSLQAGRHRLQDRYSLRCAPHVIGVYEDAHTWLRNSIENEINSSNDNPLLDPDSGEIWHGGHFYGGHIAQAMDSLKIMLANIADLLDRQLALLVDDKFNHGLPKNLTGAVGARFNLNHGFKAVHIAVSAWTAEALKLSLPASVFSRSTENHNQDKVSMGTIAARDARRVLQLSEQVWVAGFLAAKQAVYLRQRETPTLQPGAILAQVLRWAEPEFSHLEEDLALDQTMRSLLEKFRQPETVFETME